MTTPFIPTPTLSTDLLVRRPECLALVKSWFVEEWPGWYGPNGQGSIDADLRAFAACEDVLPVGMLVFEDGQPVGAGALKAESIPSHRHLGPWAAAGYVVPKCRGRGIGAFLLKGLVKLAAELGHPAIYCGTKTANTLLERSGWQLIDTTLMQEQRLSIYRFTT